MEKEKAIEIFNKWMDCKDAYQADPSCDGNCFSCEYYASAEEEKEAMLLAISALEKQEQDRWIQVTDRLPEDEYVLISKKPTKLSGSKWSVGIGIRTADQRSGKIQWRDSGFGIIQDDKVLAWKPLPEPYTEEES